MLCEILSPTCIELDIKAKRKPQIIRELVGIVCRPGGIAPAHADALTSQLMERENLGSTGIGNGIAIPHCLTSRVGDTRMAFGRKLPGVRFSAVDNQPVSLFFLLVGPDDNPVRHLQILSRIARYLHDPDFCRKLREAGCVEDVMGAFRGKEPL